MEAARPRSQSASSWRSSPLNASAARATMPAVATHAGKPSLSGHCHTRCSSVSAQRPHLPH
eukprot:8171964-Lingulodinium_polyedra.AAC.1